mgnify:CR=1 FL=1
MIKIKNVITTICFGLVSLLITYCLSGYGANFQRVLPSTVTYGQIGIQADDLAQTVVVCKYVRFTDATVRGDFKCYVGDTVSYQTPYFGACVSTETSAYSPLSVAGVATDTYTANTGGWLVLSGTVTFAKVVSSTGPNLPMTILNGGTGAATYAAGSDSSPNIVSCIGVTTTGFAAVKLQRLW